MSRIFKKNTFAQLLKKIIFTSDPKKSTSHQLDGYLQFVPNNNYEE